MTADKLGGNVDSPGNKISYTPPINNEKAYNVKTKSPDFEKVLTPPLKKTIL